MTSDNRKKFGIPEEKHETAEKMKISEETLLALRNGDHEAFREVYYHFRDPLEYFIFRIARSREVAEELTQDIFADVWEKRGTIDPSKSIKSYLYTIAKNCALNYLDKKKVRHKYALLALREERQGPAQSDEIVAAQETELLIEIAISRMPGLRRKVFTLSHHQQLSNEEISEKLGINKATVATHLSQARKDIKLILKLWILLFVV